MNREEVAKLGAEIKAEVAKLYARIEVLEAGLLWVTDNYESSLAGRPVRDADECISAARRLLADAAKESVRVPTNERAQGWQDK